MAYALLKSVIRKYAPERAALMVSEVALPSVATILVSASVAMTADANVGVGRGSDNEVACLVVQAACIAGSAVRLG